MKQEEKCKKCGYLIVMGTCKCSHKVSNWEEEFDKKFIPITVKFDEKVGQYRYPSRAIKDFISSLIKDTEKRVVEEIVGEIENKIEQYKIAKEAKKVNKLGTDYIFIYDLKTFIINKIKSKYE